MSLQFSHLVIAVDWTLQLCNIAADNQEDNHLAGDSPPFFLDGSQKKDRTSES